MNTATNARRTKRFCLSVDSFFLIELMKSSVRVELEVNTREESVDIEAERTRIRTTPIRTSPSPESIVGIDDKKIARAKLREDIAPRFDQDQIEQLKKKYVEQGIVRYHQDRSTFESKMNEEELRRIRGFVKYDGKWQSARNVVKQMFEAILKKPPQPRRKKKKETPPLKKDAVFSTGPASQMEHGASRSGFRSIYQ